MTGTFKVWMTAGKSFSMEAREERLMICSISEDNLFYKIEPCTDSPGELLKRRLKEVTENMSGRMDIHQLAPPEIRRPDTQSKQSGSSYGDRIAEGEASV